MEIGTNEFDDLDDFETQDEQNTESVEESSQEVKPEEEDFISSLLKQQGITDKNKIKFENEEGSIEEVAWDSLSNEDKFNILNSSKDDSDDLDDAEIDLINAIRESKMSPSDYMNYISKRSIDNYLNNLETPQYVVDQYSDDDLFKADFMARLNATEEEAEEALEKSKSNEELYKKEIDAIRNEYKQIEEDKIHQEQYAQQQEEQERYNQFTNSVVNEINNFNDFNGVELNLENDDMQMLYDFITGTDAAGNNHFAKALSDPRILVRTAWLALNGEQMIDDITSYYNKEITKVRKDAYQKGRKSVQDKQNKVIYRSKSKQQAVDDLDDFD